MTQVAKIGVVELKVRQESKEKERKSIASHHLSGLA